LAKAQQIDRDAAMARITAFDEQTPACAHVDGVHRGGAGAALDLKRDSA
jgi:hypothetical protein